ncbi:hypothetical protein CFIMG_003043RAa [Ceratocystis fimbriata CBS 114723]|uniref:Uncharacterized protein n=1 Tax=Ceratocystis fimbriata CBS 114723 TaxID=1035309 RepID=A0A2C5XCI4_9PEZI|nr:hypothetical protein CFIMG_003043RAa [Ceratocystis fimbriata CBS 114723]
MLRMPFRGSAVNLHVFVPRPLALAFQRRSFVGRKVYPSSAFQKPAVLSSRSQPPLVLSLVRQTIEVGSENSLLLVVDSAVMLAVERLIAWPSSCVGRDAFPRPVKAPPNIMWSLEDLTMEFTGPLKPANSKFLNPEELVQVNAFIDSLVLKFPPIYTTPSSSHNKLLTRPSRPSKAVMDPELGSKMAKPWVLLPSKLVKSPPSMTEREPDNWHMDLTTASTVDKDVKTPLGS